MDKTVAEVLVEYPELVRGEDGRWYRAQACGAPASGNTWHGWIEFEPVEGGEPACSPRETTQPNRTDTHYWATGLTTVYLEGALHRALNPRTERPAPPLQEPLFDGPAAEPTSIPPAAEAVLNPYSVIQKGEALLRRQLAALSSWHLANIVRVYRIPTGGRDPASMTPSALIDAILLDARRRALNPTSG